MKKVMKNVGLFVLQAIVWVVMCGEAFRYMELANEIEAYNLDAFVLIMPLMAWFVIWSWVSATIETTREKMNDRIEKAKEEMKKKKEIEVTN